MDLVTKSQLLGNAQLNYQWKKVKKFIILIDVIVIIYCGWNMVQSDNDNDDEN